MQSQMQSLDWTTAREPQLVEELKQARALMSARRRHWTESIKCYPYV